MEKTHCVHMALMVTEGLRRIAARIFWLLFLFLVVRQQVVAGLDLGYDRPSKFTFQLVTGCFCHAATFFGYLSLLLVAFGIALL